jgi:chromosome segregation ATPase
MDGDDMTAEPGNDDARVEEVLRINAELAAELRFLRSGQAQTSRPGPVPAAMGIARLRGERRALEIQLEETQAALQASRAGEEATRAAMENVQAHREGLERQNQEMATEILRLRTGVRGLLRRARGRLADRAGLFAAR